MKNFDWNKTWLGILMGLLLPVIALTLYFLISYNHLTISRFINYLKMSDTFTPIISLCVL